MPEALVAALALEAALVAAAFVRVVPVASFLAVPRDDVAFFGGAAFLPARTFFGGDALVAAVLDVDDLAGALAAAVGFLVVDDFEVAAGFVVVAAFAGVFFTVVDLVAALVAAGLVACAAAGLALGVGSFEAAASAALAFGVIFTRPEGPLGMIKISFSVPVCNALDS